jgi:hypothetical protein
MFNVIHGASAAKVDLIVAPPGTEREALGRRIRGSFEGSPAWFASPEDTLLAKLRWMEQGGGPVHERDCIGIARVQRDRLDLAYLRHAARLQGVDDVLERVITAAQRPG